MEKSIPEWLSQAMNYLQSTSEDSTPEEMAQRIHEALEIVEAKKYATADSRFSFVFSGTSDEDLARIRACLTPFENLIVEIKRKMDFEIGPNGEWILCGKCGMRSYNRNDVENRYCGNCHVFLQERK